MTVPSNLIPLRMTQLPPVPEGAEANDTLLPVVYNGNNYLANAGEIYAGVFVPQSREVNTGTGLTGGGDLSANRTLSIANGGVGTLQLANSGVTAGTYGNATTIPVVTVDSTGRLTGATTSAVDFSGYVPTSRQVIAGTGLTGGGALSANVTLTANLSDAIPQSGLSTGSAGVATSMSRADHKHPAVNLASSDEATGTLPIARGGTGATTLTANNVILGNGTSAVQFVAPGTSGNVLTSNGTTWTSATPVSLFGDTDSGAPFETSLGYQAGNVNTSNYCTFIGYQSGALNNTGYSNTAVGFQTLSSNTSGYMNTAVGAGSLTTNTTGNNNTAIGISTLSENITGSNNTAVGFQAGDSVTTGSNLTIIGYDADASSATATNEITLGNSSVATLRCQVTTITALSDARDKIIVGDLSAGLDFINALRPVEFDWNMRDGGKVGVRDTGFIAQEIQDALFRTGVNIPGLVYDANPEKLEVGYGKILPPLVKALQQLSAKVDELQTQVNHLLGANHATIR